MCGVHESFRTILCTTNRENILTRKWNPLFKLHEDHSKLTGEYIFVFLQLLLPKLHVAVDPSFF